LEAAKVINDHDALLDVLKEQLRQLPPMQIGEWGQLQEWLDDLDDPKDDHRHFSHLYGLYPSNQISPYRTPALFQAARTSLTARGDVSTGWSMGWKVCQWARQLDGDHALQLIKNQLKLKSPNASIKDPDGGTYANMFDAHPPFQIDGNFGCCAGIAEMLVQSYDGSVHVLPALPEEWAKEGCVTGLRARGGFEIVKLQWKDGKVNHLVIKSTLGGNLRIRSAEPLLTVTRTKVPVPYHPARYTTKIELTPLASAPHIVDVTKISTLRLKQTRIYDIPMEKDQQIELVTPYSKF
jgi:hypothetical protein